MDNSRNAIEIFYTAKFDAIAQHDRTANIIIKVTTKCVKVYCVTKTTDIKMKYRYSNDANDIATDGNSRRRQYYNEIYPKTIQPRQDQPTTLLYYY